MIRSFISISLLATISAVISFLSILAVEQIEWVGGHAWPGSRLIGVALVGVMFLLLGLSTYWSPWRWIWRRIPHLNQLVFPDLNGIWIGTARSNWPRIKALLDAATGSGGLDVNHPHIPLGENVIAIQIEADWFNVKLRARLESAKADSVAIALEPRRKFNDWDFALAYVYKQTSSHVESTDAETHEGSAIVEIVPGTQMLLRGHYWTKRKWHDGLNTAGELLLRKVSDKHVSKSDDLLAAAKLAATST